MNVVEQNIIAQVVLQNALAQASRQSYGMSGTLLTILRRPSRGMGDCGCGCAGAGTCGGFGAAPAGAPVDYVCAGTRFRYVATVTQGTASAAPIVSPNSSIQQNLTAQGVQVNSITDNAGVLSYVAGSFASWQITVDCIWPIDMTHRADVQSVCDAAVANSGLNVTSSSLALIQDACSQGPSAPTVPAPVPVGTPGNLPAASSPGVLASIENAISSATTSGAAGWVLIIGGTIAGLLVVKSLLGKR